MGSAVCVENTPAPIHVHTYILIFMVTIQEMHNQTPVELVGQIDAVAKRHVVKCSILHMCRTKIF